MRHPHGSHFWVPSSAPPTNPPSPPPREERDLPGGVGERAAAPPGGRLRARPGQPPGAPGPGARPPGGAAALAQPGRPQGAVTAQDPDGHGKNGNGQPQRVFVDGVRAPAPRLPVWDVT